MNVGKWVVVHTLFEVDGIKDFQSVSMLQKSLTSFDHHVTLWKHFVKTKMVSFELKKEPYKRFPYLETCARNGVNEFTAFLRLTSGEPYTVAELLGGV